MLSDGRCRPCASRLEERLIREHLLNLLPVADPLPFKQAPRQKETKRYQRLAQMLLAEGCRSHGCEQQCELVANS